MTKTSDIISSMPDVRLEEDLLLVPFRDTTWLSKGTLGMHASSGDLSV